MSREFRVCEIGYTYFRINIFTKSDNQSIHKNTLDGLRKSLTHNHASIKLFTFVILFGHTNSNDFEFKLTLIKLKKLKQSTAKICQILQAMKHMFLSLRFM